MRIGDDKMGFIPNIFRKIKTKIIQFLKGEDGFDIYDADGNKIGRIYKYNEWLVICDASGNGIVALNDGVVRVIGGTDGDLRIKSNYNLIKPHLLPFGDDIYEWGASNYRPHRIWVGTGGFYSDSKHTINSAIAFNLNAQSTPPANPSKDDVYLDDGTNTADGKPHLRYYDGTTWHDL